MALSESTYQVAHIFISQHVNDIHTAWSINITQSVLFVEKAMAPCRGPAWGIPPVTRSCRRKPDKTEGRDQASGVPPGISWASTPQKIRICLLFHSSDILWKKSTQGFSLLHLKGMFQLNPSHSSLACLTGSSRPLTACELLTAPQPREAQSLKAS